MDPAFLQHVGVGCMQGPIDPGGGIIKVVGLHNEWGRAGGVRLYTVGKKGQHGYTPVNIP